MTYNVYYSCYPNIRYKEYNFDLEIEDIKKHTGYTYSQCPVWNHRHNRTYICYSPSDFSLKIEDTFIEYKLGNEKPVILYFEDLENNVDYDDDILDFTVSDMDKKFPVLQLKFLGSFFWTDFENDYMWFEFLDHPYTAANNNFVAIGGWFNIANHPRTSSLALQICNPEEELYIEKGDPLYRIRFYTQDINDNISLTKKKITEKDIDAMDDRRKILSEDPKFRNKILFDKDARSQCPYHNS